MRKLALFISIIGAGCLSSGASTGTQTGTIMSCFDSSKSGGLACIDTPKGPETQAKDVDDDGTDDKFECADRDSDDDGTPDFEDADDDHGGGSGSSSLTSHDGSDDGSGSGSADGDQDDDGIDDDQDCGTPPQPPV
ncbi:MAG TPA: hypothetical protein VL463_12295 [Kofleriaceae bacterium]|jgi:hypothetical protein|nr:hypothetical protein [Kofleriaceae bacterium]